MSSPRFSPAARRDLLVAAGFAAVSFVEFGWPLLPHPGRAILGTGPDPDVFVWSFAWWPHAIFGGTDPFVTHALYAPGGVNLVWVTSVPALALAFTPLTLLAGPVVSFDVAALLLPALAAWACTRLCLALTRSLWAALVGGYLFGFSSFVLAQQLQGHVNLTGEFVLPLVALCVLRLVRGEWTARRGALGLALLLALQFAISTEVALTLGLALVVSLALAAALVREARPGLRRAVGPLLAGVSLAALVASPLLVYAALGFQRGNFSGGQGSGTDLANLVAPTQVNGLLGTAFPSLTPDFDLHESALYLGLPTLVVAALYAWRTRREGAGRFLVLALLAAVLLALGPTLIVAGRTTSVSLPWRLLGSAPGFDNVHVPRLAEYAALAAAVISALWIAGARGRVFARPYVLPALAVAAIVPAGWHALAVTRFVLPPFFSSALEARCLAPGETIALFPFPGDDLAQALDGFRFSLAGGYLQAPVYGEHQVIGFNNDPTVVLLDFYGDRGLPSVGALRAFAARHDVARVVSIVGDGYPTPAQLRAIGPVERVGGVEVAPACGAAPLTRRALPRSARLVGAEQLAGVQLEYCLDGYTYQLPAGLVPGRLLRGATRAVDVAGVGLVCSAPAGSRRDGLAPAGAGIPGSTYAYYLR